ncbi:hypothetical protein pdam_00023749 [Pocillopora damicornis]|uniref:Uncharacterized protein n=1 Tax=Pocillopora damicornis TaxID=46731 RepID=A0A3M6U251_POCDA|nr:hypothetical protein pdam_00023749 [Pocillopora damicornis]
MRQSPRTFEANELYGAVRKYIAEKDGYDGRDLLAIAQDAEELRMQNQVLRVRRFKERLEVTSDPKEKGSSWIAFKIPTSVKDLINVKDSHNFYVVELDIQEGYLTSSPKHSEQQYIPPYHVQQTWRAKWPKTVVSHGLEKPPKPPKNEVAEGYSKRNSIL